MVPPNSKRNRKLRLLLVSRMCACVLSHSVMSDSLRPHRLYVARLLYLWDSPGKTAGVGCHALLQGILPTQGSNQRLLRLLPRQGDSLRLSHLGSRCHIVGVPTTVLTIIPLKLSNTRCCTTGIRRPGSVLPLTRCMTLGKSPNTSESHVLICEMRSLYLIYPKILLRSKILVSWKRKTNTIWYHLYMDSKKINCSVAKSCSTLRDFMDCGVPGFPVLYCLPDFAQIHVHWVGDAI